MNKKNNTMPVLSAIFFAILFFIILIFIYSYTFQFIHEDDTFGYAVYNWMNPIVKFIAISKNVFIFFFIFIFPIPVSGFCIFVLMMLLYFINRVFDRIIQKAQDILNDK